MTVDINKQVVDTVLQVGYLPPQPSFVVCIWTYVVGVLGIQFNHDCTV